MLLAALASVVIASCYDGDTCTTTNGERVRLACIDSPELRGNRAQPVLAEAACIHLRDLVVGQEVGIRRITEDRYGRFSDYEVQANSKTEAEAIANKPENVVDGSIVISIEKLAPFHL